MINSKFYGNAAAPDFFRSGVGVTKPDDTNDTTENISRQGLTGFGITDPSTVQNTNETFGTTSNRIGTNYSAVGVQNDVVFSANSTIRFTGVSAQTINGIAGGTDGEFMYLHNASGFDATLANQNVGSLAANRISTGTGSDFTFKNGAMCMLQYDPTSLVWRIVGGGGGASKYHLASQAIVAGTPFVVTHNLALVPATSLIIQLLDTTTNAPVMFNASAFTTNSVTLVTAYTGNISITMI